VLLLFSPNEQQLFYCEETASLNFAVNVYQFLILTQTGVSSKASNHASATKWA